MTETDSDATGKQRDTRRILGWIVYHTDWSGMVFYTNEISALRHAVAHEMKVFPVRNGDDLRVAADRAAGVAS